jgi:sugar/nucleoside kinase (ribokinase family)
MTMMLHYDQIVGVGGIGTGILFELDSDRPLSRNETRMSRLSPAKDYCKQHIILHYIARILAPDAAVYAIGMVGRDAEGDRLREKMREAGINVSLVGQTVQQSTMYCVCIQYPDKAVCNLTTSQSACSLVSAAYVSGATASLPRPMDARTVAVAVPEVPVEARLELLSCAKAAGAYCVSSYLVDEYPAFRAGGGLKNTDLLAINEDEAAACCGEYTENLRQLARMCQAQLIVENPSMRLLMTCGARGSYVCEGNEVRHIPAIRTEIVATGGAGDAYVSGCVCGLALGMPFLPGEALSVPELGAYLASEAIRVPDTIAEHIDRALVWQFIGRQGA